MLRDAIEKKKTALFLLASAQSDVEIHTSYLIEECGLEETIHFYDAHHDDIGDHHTAIGRFIKVVSRITVSHPAVDRQGPVRPSHFTVTPDVSSLPFRSMYAMDQNRILHHL